MKKRFLPYYFLLILTVVFCSIFAMACTTESDAEQTTVRVVFSQNYKDAPEAQVVSLQKGELVEKPDDPVRDGYKFGYWATNVAGNVEYDFSTPVEGNLRLFAKWLLSEASFTFVYNNGSEPTTQVVEVGEKVQRPETDPIRTNYLFTGWYSDQACTKLYDFNQEVTENISVYAGWKQTDATVTAVLYGDVTQDLGKVAIGEKLTRPADPVRADYRFTGWYSDRLCTTEYDFESVINSDVTIYAGWEQVKVTITLQPNYEGATATTLKADVGTTISGTDIDEPERTGYDFTGWYEDAEATSEFDFASVLNENITLYAGWERKTFTISFEPNGGSDVPAQSVKFEDKVELVEPTKSGYSFEGWYTDSALTNVYDFDAPVESSFTLYAKWLKNSGEVTDKQLIYDLNYDTDNKIFATVDFGTKTSLIPATAGPKDDPERFGYVFAGWYEDAACTAKANLRKSVKDTTTFYAKWNKTYTFEAEYTDLTDVPWNGTSDNGSGFSGLGSSIRDASTLVNAAELVGNVSGGYFVQKLFNPESILTFHVTSDKTVENVSISIRISADLYDLMFEGTQKYTIEVNGTKYYLDQNLTGAYSEGAQSGLENKRPFENCFITASADLKEGDNIIRLIPSNTDAVVGTIWALAPMVDCIYISADANLSWTKEYTKPEQVGHTWEQVEASYAVTKLWDYEGE